jgi:hypothetical protein
VWFREHRARSERDAACRPLEPGTGLETSAGQPLGLEEPRWSLSPWQWSAVLALGVAEAVATALTTPFSTASNLAVAAGFVLMAIPFGHTLALRSRRRRRRTLPSRPRSSLMWGRGRAWLVAITVLLVVELVSYFAGFDGGRHSFPTVSSLYDAASRWTALKAAIVFAWLALGWGLFAP